MFPISDAWTNVQAKASHHTVPRCAAGVSALPLSPLPPLRIDRLIDRKACRKGSTASYERKLPAQ